MSGVSDRDRFSSQLLLVFRFFFFSFTHRDVELSRSGEFRANIPFDEGEFCSKGFIVLPRRGRFKCNGGVLIEDVTPCSKSFGLSPWHLVTFSLLNFVSLRSNIDEKTTHTFAYARVRVWDSRGYNKKGYSLVWCCISNVDISFTARIERETRKNANCWPSQWIRGQCLRPMKTPQVMKVQNLRRDEWKPLRITCCVREHI